MFLLLVKRAPRSCPRKNNNITILLCPFASESQALCCSALRSSHCRKIRPASVCHHQCTKRFPYSNALVLVGNLCRLSLLFDNIWVFPFGPFLGARRVGRKLAGIMLSTLPLCVYGQNLLCAIACCASFRTCSFFDIFDALGCA